MYIVGRGFEGRREPSVKVLTHTGPDWTDVTTAIATSVAAGATLVTLGIISVGAFIAWQQVQETRRSRHAQFMTDYMSRWDDDRMLEARRLAVSFRNREGLRDAVEKRFRANSPDYYKLMRIPGFFETLATLEEQRSVSESLLSRHFGEQLINEFELWEPSIRFLRQEGGGGLEGFERLANEERQRRGMPPTPSVRSGITRPLAGIRRKTLSPWRRRRDQL